MKPRPAVAALLLVVLLGLLGLTACSGAEEDSGGGDSAASDAGGSVAAGEPEADAFAGDSDGAMRSTVERAAPDGPAEAAVPERALIRKGNVALSADDVGKARFEVQQVVDRYAGDVSADETATDDDGKPAYTRMVLRIPTESFDDAMAALEDAADLESSSTDTNDVTAKLIDTQTRLAAQRRSIARITVLFDRAESIRDIMRIESELSRRQADLESLERQAGFLRSQTSMSTITVSIDRTLEKKAAEKEDTDEAGFLTGLSAGWDALTTFAVGLATALGALLPWLVVLAILGIPAALIWRRRRGATPGGTGRTPSAA